MKRPFDVERIRADFPILATEARGNPLVYLDNAATSQKPRAVIDALVRYYESSNANAHRGVHYLSERATAAYEEAREKVARFIGAAQPEEIVFVRGATEGLNMVAHSWAWPRIRTGDGILVTRMEHHANFVPWQQLAKEKGARFAATELTAEYRIDMDDFRAKLADLKPKVVAVTLMSNVLGVVNPVREIAELARAAGAVVVVDAAQAIAHFPVDVRALGPIDFLVFSGHKMFAPTGVGVLWGRMGRLEEMRPYHWGGHMIAKVADDDTTFGEIPSRFEAGTANIEGVIGLAAAIDYLERIDFARAAQYEHELGGYLLARLSQIEGVKILGPTTNENRGAVVSFTLADVHSQDLAQFLDMEGIAIRSGHLCAQPLLTKCSLHSVSRVSLAFYNTRAEVDRLCEAIEKTKTYFQRARGRA